jgi:Flp pilus assembly protein TadD
MMLRAAVRGGRDPADQGSGVQVMARFYAAASLLALGALALGGCVQVAPHLDPLAVSGRDGGQPVTYDTLMRLAGDAHAGGDLAAAVGFYRRAAALDDTAVAPFVGAGNTLLEMGNANEAIVAYNAALARNEHDPEALRGLAKANLLTGKPELAGAPLGTAYQQTPNDPKLLQLIGVADDYSGEHAEAQARYRRGLELLPHDPGLSLDLALSLALTGDYQGAIAVLQPVALARGSSPRERQTLALIYGLAGDRIEAARIGRLDLDPQAVEHNLAYYDSLRRLAPEARARAIRSLSTHTDAQTVAQAHAS